MDGVGKGSLFYLHSVPPKKLLEFQLLGLLGFFLCSFIFFFVIERAHERTREQERGAEHPKQALH